MPLHVGFDLVRELGEDAARDSLLLVREVAASALRDRAQPSSEELRIEQYLRRSKCDACECVGGLPTCRSAGFEASRVDSRFAADLCSLQYLCYAFTAG